MASKKEKKILTNRDKLERIMIDHDMTSTEVAQLLDYVPETVRAWRSGRYPTPTHAITLLELHIASR